MSQVRGRREPFGAQASTNWGGRSGKRVVPISWWRGPCQGVDVGCVKTRRSQWRSRVSGGARLSGEIFVLALLEEVSSGFGDILGVRVGFCFWRRNGFGGTFGRDVGFPIILLFEEEHGRIEEADSQKKKANKPGEEAR